MPMPGSTAFADLTVNVHLLPVWPPRDHRGYGNLGDYIDSGYVPFESNPNGSSMTLEYAYDDWTIARLAESLGETGIAGKFQKRSENWKILFDEKTGFVRARDKNGNWKTPFDPMHTANEGFH